MSWRRRLLLAALASLTATAALAILILLFGEFGETQVRILATTLSVSLYSVLTLPGALLTEQRDARPLALANLVAAAAAFLFVLLVIWVDEESDTLWRLLGTATAFAVGLAQTAATTARLRDDDGPWIRRAFSAAAATVAVLVALALFGIWAEPEDEWFVRALAALGVFDVFLVVLQPLLRRLDGGVAGEVTVTLVGTREQVEDALRRAEGTGVRVRR